MRLSNNNACHCAYEEMAQSADNTSRVWDAPGRGTPAGRALFRLYNGFAAARHKGEEFSFQNRLNILRRLSSGSASHETAPQPAPANRKERTVFMPVQKPKVTVRVPRFRRKVEDVPSYPVGVGKRKASLIIEKTREEFENMSIPPPPTKPVLDDKEKQRLQTLFEWHGLLDEGEVLMAPKVTPAPCVPKGSKEEKEQLLDMISKEIEEREAFLEDMQKFGKDEPYRTQIQLEIQDRVKQMKQLDKLISADEEKLAKSRLESRKSVTWW